LAGSVENLGVGGKYIGSKIIDRFLRIVPSIVPLAGVASTFMSLKALGPTRPIAIINESSSGTLWRRTVGSAACAISADRHSGGPRKFNFQTVISPRPNIAMTSRVDLLEEDFKYYNSVKQVVLIVRLNIPINAG
jgi:hypothetical protein